MLLLRKIAVRQPQQLCAAVAHQGRRHQSVTISGSVDSDDVERHAKLAQDWWNPKGPMKALHSLNSIRVPFIRDGLIATSPHIQPALVGSSSVLSGLRLLEVGCGAGVLTESLARLHAHVTAIDPGADVIAAARRHLQTYETPTTTTPPPANDIAARIDYRNETIEAHAPAHPARYDAVVVSEVLEHVCDKEAFLRECVAVVRPGGSVFITTFNRTCASWWGAIVAAEHVLGLVPRGTHQWEQFATPVETQRWLREAECAPVLVNGFVYEVWSDRWRWIPTLELSYAVHAVKQA